MSAAAICLTLALLALGPAPAAHADSYGHGVPRGTRAVEGDPDRYVSGRGLRDTIDFYKKELDRRGLAHRRIGPYRVRGVDVVRFVLDAGDLAAVHVYRAGGKTLISFVKRARS
jgi:hypothetical protein